jgi:multicomponent Na+:H+ antiporter subunit E
VPTSSVASITGDGANPRDEAIAAFQHAGASTAEARRLFARYRARSRTIAFAIARTLSPIGDALPGRLIFHRPKTSLRRRRNIGDIWVVKLDRSSLGLRGAEDFFWLWLLLTFLWIAANSSLAVESVVSGALISAALAYIFTQRTDVWQGIRFSPSRLYHFIRYTGVFVVELLRANFNMMRYVYALRIDIRPGVVKIRTRLKTPLGRLALANSIALTPGSLVLDIEDDTLFIHWLDVKTTDPDEATRMIAGPFEEHLEKAFG